ncbi:hypothetical protein EV363DRAFT_1351585 [Boletus edulis]|uniref:Uncharacterized protein n=1 Tax=Boletus edulis BED1 TaxID=1328754 RepID=A0AAD4BZC4_BOLED|nr:hypothetical protein EV363DRAFT_1351585 [Boletus edulis]KAF8443318.1 hypothetical protein L210DRAFT_3535543 [Boletus edulis BED1]
MMSPVSSSDKVLMIKSTTAKMEFFFDVLSILPPTEKPVAMSQSMETTLNTPRRYAPGEWIEHVLQCNYSELERYVVTDVFHYKERNTFPDLQHEYIVLRVQPKSSSTSAPPHTDIKLSRTIRNHGLSARFGLWGSATDTVEVQAPPSDGPSAPTLLRISLLVVRVHDRMPFYCLLKTSCYAFARAIKDAVYRKYNGSATVPNRPRFLTRQSYFMSCIPAGITAAQKVAEIVTAY